MQQQIEALPRIAYNPGMVEWPDISFPAICKELREWKKFTQEEMARYLGVAVRAYKYWEAGTRKPSAVGAFRIAMLKQEMDAKKKK